MSVEIVHEPISVLGEYGMISSAYTVDQRYVVGPIEGGLAGLDLEPVEPPFVKNYDRDNGHGPEGWHEQWDMAHWGVLSAFDDSTRLGGALIGWDTPQIDILDGRADLAVLWDIRVGSNYRSQGIGSAIFRSVLDWARERNLIAVKIETQNINVPACRFYARQGCRLTAINPFAYPDLPEEAQFIWMIDT
ncbi:MAG: GNAT family N-acetyltransferase [Planctomycetota bacterium]|nr:GNAT family N-acetyltransferase [Planctomycetota bacterium]